VRCQHRKQQLPLSGHRRGSPRPSSRAHHRGADP
jgi:hypothetical protein